MKIKGENHTPFRPIFILISCSCLHFLLRFAASKNLLQHNIADFMPAFFVPILFVKK